MAAGVLGLSLTPMYRATALAVPADSGPLNSVMGGATGALGGLASLAGLSMSGGSNTEAARALLESRQVISSVVETRALLPQLFPERWDANARKWSVTDPAEIPTLDDGAKRFIEHRLLVEFDAVNGQARVSVDWEDPSTAAELANEIVAEVNKVLREKAGRNATSALALLNRELATTDAVEVRDAIYKLIQEQLKYSVLSRAREEFALTVLDPAIPPNRNDVHWPRMDLMIVAGAFVGFLLGCFFSLAALVLRATYKK